MTLKSRPKVVDIISLRPPKQSRIELGIACRNGVDMVYWDVNGEVSWMTADQAEARAGDIMQFVHELRNGGKLA